jgi:L-lactate dehydrogenase complex protein LldG
MGHRLLPFSCESLVLLLHAKDLVPDMHEAAERISLSGEGYGVYIAGPSKTADIEQSLVIGAHGPLGLTVFLLP